MIADFLEDTALSAAPGPTWTRLIDLAAEDPNYTRLL